jgi:hypothetical protein
METVIQAAGAAGIMITGIALVATTVELRRLRVALQSGRLRRLVDPEDDVVACCGIGAGGRAWMAGGYAIYVYRHGGWALEEDFSAAGHEPAPPAMNGSYENEAVTTRSILKRVP